MRKIDKLLYLEIIPPFLIALTVLTFVVFLNEIGKWAELVITKNASFWALAIIAGTILPRIMILTLPLSYLIGTLIGVSGLAGEQQITALRTCGVPLRRMAKPVLTMSVVVGLATGVMSLVILPATNDILANLRKLVNLRMATSQIVPRVFNEDFANVVFYLDELSIDRQNWDRVFLADNSDPRAPRIVLAEKGTWISDAGGSRLQLHLENGRIYEVNQQDPSKDNVSVFGATDIPIDFNRGAGAEAKGTSFRDPTEQPTADLWRGRNAQTPAQRQSQLIELHRRMALPCSVFGFALLGLSLGICSRRGGRTSGSALGLLLVILYYVLFLNGFNLAKVGSISPWLGLWGPDILLIGIGVLLLVSAEQNRWLTQCSMSGHWKARFDSFVVRFHLAGIRKVFRILDDLALSSTGRLAKLRFPKVIDAYVSRGFIVYFLWAQTVCTTLYILLTMFELLDDIIRHKASVFLLIRYFTFLLPHILLLIVPMSVLLAILIQFGVLEKGSEVTALKAGGWSLYRIAMPVFLLSGFICAGIYFMQDYILPYANQRQDELRNIIKGRPPQTYRRPRKWIFGESGRIYNYDLFDAGKDLFVGLNVYEVDLRRLSIRRRVFAQQATISPQGKWVLENGWVRDFRSQDAGFRPITRSTFEFPEQANYFRREFFEPKESAKLTFLELNNYINYLKQSGYNATELQVELNKKISFPLSSFVMALLGIPFAFSMGRRGAFYGITASVGIAMSYWGIFSVFEQLGAYGMLAPLLAAWAPNVLFGAAGLALLLTIRT
ncbi:MAG: transporter, YjgP/YjgQ family [Acidobacteria bacterium]|nr:transporter, YjgP/YjgQ family [Acidobacteriota bacterium]